MSGCGETYMNSFRLWLAALELWLRVFFLDWFEGLWGDIADKYD